MEKVSITWYVTRIFVLGDMQLSQEKGGQHASICILYSFKEEFRVFVQGFPSISFNDFLDGLQHLNIRE